MLHLLLWPGKNKTQNFALSHWVLDTEHRAQKRRKAFLCDMFKQTKKPSKSLFASTKDLSIKKSNLIFIKNVKKFTKPINYISGGG